MPISGGGYSRPTNSFAQPVNGQRFDATAGAATLDDFTTAIDALVKGTGQADGGLANAKLANMAEATFKGRPDDSGSGSPLDLPISVVDVRHFGAVLDGVTDDTQAFLDAIATGRSVYFPTGAAYVTDLLTLQNGQILYGDGRTKSRFIIDEEFNLSAIGVIRLGAGEPGATLRGVGLYFSQPDTAVRAELIAYPPAIFARGAPRFRVESVRVSLGMTGIDMKNNSGGANVIDFEVCCFDTDIDIDGSLDSVRLDRVHHWVFSGVSGIITTNQRSIYSDATHIGLNVGGCDDLHISNWVGFSIPQAMRFWNGSGAAGNFANIVNADFDDRGGLVVEGSACRIRIANGFFSMGKDDSRFIAQSAGTLTLVNPRYEYSGLVGTPANDLISLSGSARFTSVGGTASRGSTDLGLLKSSGSGVACNIIGLQFDMTATATFSKTLMEFGDARGCCIGVTGVTTRSSGSGVAVSSTRSDGLFTVSACQLASWSASVGVSASPSNAAGASLSASAANMRASSAAPSAANSAGGAVRIATGNATTTDEALIFGVEDAVAAWIQSIKPGTGTRPLLLQPVGNDVLIGALSALVSSNSSAAFIGLRGASSSGRFETSTGAADGDAVNLGHWQFADATSTLSEKRRALIRGQLAGSTANQRGGRVIISTTANGSNTISDRLSVKELGQVRLHPLSADPATLEDGDVWYNSTAGKLRVRAGGATIDLH